MRRYSMPFLAAAVIAGGSVFATRTFTLHGTPALAQVINTSDAKATTRPEPQAVAPATDLSKAFRAVHSSVKDAVVNIKTTKKINVAGAERPGRGGRVHPQIPEDLRRFFGPDFELPMPPGGEGGRLSGTGSGVIVSADGYILTNNHVVEEADADGITVRLDDGRELKAKTVGRDPKTDLAVVKIDVAANDKLTYARLGDSDALDVGDWVLAFGSPFGFEQSMTQGIISAKGRSNVNIIGSHNPALAGFTYENFLQTDAAINPGNSGGPLVNLKGEVVGINTAIASRTGAYNGIGFAIPSNDARSVMDSLIKNGKVVRGYIGAGIVDVRNPGVRERVSKEGFTARDGVLVTEVHADAPSAKGGLKAGDIITAINGKPVSDITQLRGAIARTTPGDKIALNVWRDGKTVDIAFPVGEQPETRFAAGAARRPAVKEPTFDAPELGLSVKPLDEATAKKTGLAPGKGVVVAATDDSGLAAQTGLSVGDVITSVNRTAVTSPEEFNDALKKSKLSDGIRLTVRAPDGGERLVYIEKK